MHRGMERGGTLVKDGAVMGVSLCIVGVDLGLDYFESVWLARSWAVSAEDSELWGRLRGYDVVSE
jgi:hypothetical protein